MKARPMMGRLEAVFDIVPHAEAIADLGSRGARLNLTEERLSGQTDDFTDLMSNNENADLTETVINFNAQKVIYNASLQAGAKVVQNSLLDFLR